MSVAYLNCNTVTLLFHKSNLKPPDGFPSGGGLVIFRNYFGKGSKLFGGQRFAARL